MTTPASPPTRPALLRTAPGHWISIVLLVISLGLVVAVYLLYRASGWPLGTQGLEGLVAILVVAITLGFGVWFGRFSGYRADRSLLVGLGIGVLWAAEISINNFLTPALPWRDIIDNVFWATVAASILAYAAARAYRTRSLAAGVEAGLWTGFASGLVACVTALLITVFGIELIVNDLLTAVEFQRQRGDLTDPAVFSAYETLFGALGHLHLIGTVMGVILGLLGGVVALAALAASRRA